MELSYSQSQTLKQHLNQKFNLKLQYLNFSLKQEFDLIYHEAEANPFLSLRKKKFFDEQELSTQTLNENYFKSSHFSKESWEEFLPKEALKLLSSSTLQKVLSKLDSRGFFPFEMEIYGIDIRPFFKIVRERTPLKWFGFFSLQEYLESRIEVIFSKDSDSLKIAISYLERFTLILEAFQRLNEKDNPETFSLEEEVLLWKQKLFQDLMSEFNVSQREIEEILNQISDEVEIPYPLVQKEEPILLERGVTYEVSIDETLKIELISHDLFQDRLEVKEVLSKESLSQEEKKLYHRAVMLKNMVTSRQELKEKLIFYMVKKQSRFLLKKGEKVPLSLKELSQLLGIHLSSVSRLMREEKINVNGEVFFLKSLMDRSVRKNGQVSQDHIQKRIKNLILLEHKSTPFSDQELAQILKQEGISLSARSISSYRQKLGILPKRLRKLI